MQFVHHWHLDCYDTGRADFAVGVIAVSVNLLLRSGERRLLKDADGAYVDGRFFIVTKRTHAERVTVLTLSAADVVQADVISEEGGTTVIGGGASPLARDWNERAQRPVSEL